MNSSLSFGRYIKRTVSNNGIAKSSTSSSSSSFSSIELENARFPHPPPSLDSLAPGWSSDEQVYAASTGTVAPARRIFCNRTLNLAKIKSVGFDMDYTLAQYRPESFELLVYRETLKKLCEAFGYPLEVLQLEFDWRFMVRGLTIDKKRGNILKMDRHKYVKVAYHGFKQLSREERRSTYTETEQREAFDEPDYALIDTLFSLAEAHLFAQLVDMKDAEPDIMPEGKTYADLYKDVRRSVDLVHRDGSLKQAVAKNPEAFIHTDEGLPEIFQMIRKSGKKVFIVTNSLWDYTNVVMNYLLSGKIGVDKDLEWMNYFDLVVTGSAKPGFFFDTSRQMFEVDADSGMLMNTDNGAPLVPIGHDAPSIPAMPVVKELDSNGRAPVYQGGNYRILHQLLGVQSGSEIMYVGDHIYGDIVRSKKSLGWRTMLVVPELEHELENLQSQKTIPTMLRAMREKRDGLDDQIQRLEWQMKHMKEQLSSSCSLTSELERLRSERNSLREEHSALLKRYHESFHSVWGQLMKTGHQNSRFAGQVERFACLYTSHVSNMRGYSPVRCFRSREDGLPHDFT